MKISQKSVIFSLLVSVMAMFLNGCSTVLKTAPSSPISFDAGSMERNDYVILDRVEGISTTTSILFGLVKIIDGNKWKLFWLFPFYEEEYAYQIPPSFPFNLLSFVSTQERAYYKALAKTPDADSVIQKAFSIESTEIPTLFKTEKVTITGKAIKLKTDKEK